MTIEKDIFEVRYKSDSPEIKKLKRLVIIFTTLYGVALPFVVIFNAFIMIYAGVTLKDAPVRQFFNCTLPLLGPLSLCVSIAKMWSNFYKQKVERVQFYALLPVFTFMFYMFVSFIIG